jgi:hypothetical protein
LTTEFGWDTCPGCGCTVAYHQKLGLYELRVYPIGYKHPTSVSTSPVTKPVKKTGNSTGGTLKGPGIDIIAKATETGELTTMDFLKLSQTKTAEGAIGLLQKWLEADKGEVTTSVEEPPKETINEEPVDPPKHRFAKILKYKERAG